MAFSTELCGPCVPVVIEEHIDDILEELRLAWGKEATLDLIQDLLKLWQLLVILHGVIAERKMEKNDLTTIKQANKQTN